MIARLFAMLLCCIALSPAHAADALTSDQVKDLVGRAVDVVATNGLEKAHAEFSAEGPYRFADTYVNVIDFDGVWRVYPPKPANEGKSVLGVQDADGKFVVQEIIRLVRDQGEGWIEYRWQNPATNRVQLKASYVKRVPHQNLIVYVGLYK